MGRVLARSGQGCAVYGSISPRILKKSLRVATDNYMVSADHLGGKMRIWSIVVRKQAFFFYQNIKL